MLEKCQKPHKNMLEKCQKCTKMRWKSVIFSVILKKFCIFGVPYCMKNIGVSTIKTGSNRCVPM